MYLVYATPLRRVLVVPLPWPVDCGSASVMKHSAQSEKKAKFAAVPTSNVRAKDIVRAGARVFGVGVGVLFLCFCDHRIMSVSFSRA